MIKGIENFIGGLQKSILQFIAANVDVTDDVEVVEIDDNIIDINDVRFYVITDNEQQRKLAKFNSDAFDDFFDGLDDRQMEYIDEEKWYENCAITNFSDWIEECTEYSVSDSDYFGSYNFYEIH